MISILEECTEKKVEKDMNLIDELEMNSIEVLNFVIAIEERFGVEFNEFSELSQHMVTVGEMIDFLSCFFSQEVNENE